MAKLKVDQALLRARKHARNGEIEDARALYQAILATFPNNARARQALAQLGPAKSAPARMSHPTKAQLDAVVADIQSDALTAAIAKGEALLKSHPKSFVLWNILGAAHKKQGDLDKAEAAFRMACQLKPDLVEAHNNMGIVLSEKGAHDAAIPFFEKAIALRSGHHDAHRRLGAAHLHQGRHAVAIEAFEQALALVPDDVETLCYMGMARMEQNRFQDAVSAYRRATELRTTDPNIYNNLAIALKDCGQLEESIATYHKAIDLQPDHAVIHTNLSNALRDAGQLEEARAAAQRAAEIAPDYALAHNTVGDTSYSLGQFEAAVVAYKRVLEIEPEAGSTETNLRYAMKQCCDWNPFIETGVARLGIETEPVAPFPMLAMDDNAQRQLHRAQAWAETRDTGIEQMRPAQPKQKPSRLRIGYFGADFYNHPSLYLMMGMFSNHDPERVDVSIYSYGTQKGGDLRKRAMQTVDQFHDIAEMRDDAVIDKVRADQLDVAIDLMGYTRGERLSLFQRGLAPVQATYLGFPGTLGSTFTEYLIADPTVIAENRRDCFSENIIYLPHSYLPNDNTLEISDIPTTRADFGLPEEAFVLCSFNNSYKITRHEFDIWMRVLSKTENSVLWLLKPNVWSAPNLLKEAKARGVDPDRIIFANKVPHPVHLARHRHADLFVDTFIYNAHTTASEALWAGLPIVTKIGDQFAARVAASVLTAMNLPELITTSEDAYEALILDLATDRDRLKRIRDRVQATRLTAPFFNSEQNTRAFEDGLRQAYDLWFEGAPPQDIRVAAKRR